MKKRYSAVLAAAVGLVLCVRCPDAAYAGGPLISGTETEEGVAEGPALEGAVTTETEEAELTITAELLDGRIEYGELEPLIRLGNASAVNLLNSYSDSLASYQAAYDAMLTSRRDMLNKAEEVEEEGGAQELIDYYEQNASLLYNSATRFKRTITSLTSASSDGSRNRSIWTLTKSAQALMASCVEMEAQAATAEKTVEAKQAALERMQREREAGLATEDEVLQAEKSLLSAQNALQSVQDSRDQLKRQLARMLGKGAEQLQLGEIPEVTESELSSLNPETEEEIAVIANSGVKSVKNSSAAGDAERKLRRQQLEEAEGAALVTVKEQYSEIETLRLARDAAVMSFAAAEKDYHALQTKYSAGIINRASYLTGETEYLQKKASYLAAQAELRLAYDSYQWLLKGVE